MMAATRCLRTLGACLVAAVLAGWPGGGTAEEVLHGADAVFRVGSLTIVWAIARDRDDAKTAVVVRIVDGAKRFAAIEVEGLDPFTKKRAMLVPKRAIGGTHDVMIPRSSFADWPQSEIHFYAAGSDQPMLTVYYLGVPDTTPEFADPSAVQNYLGKAAQ